jgi:predicted DNA-binding protein
MTLDEKIQKYIKENPTKTKVLSFRVKEEEYKKLQKIAERNKTTIATVIQIAIEGLIK